MHRQLFDEKNDTALSAMGNPILGKGDAAISLANNGV
jgi:hypothetical protein